MGVPKFRSLVVLGLSQIGGFVGGFLGFVAAQPLGLVAALAGGLLGLIAAYILLLWLYNRLVPFVVVKHT